MTDRAFECYEDNAGRLFIVALEEAGDELRPVWGATYYGERDRLGYTGEEYAGMDWAGLVVQGLDPVREGWEGLSPDDLARCCCDDRWTKIADSSDWERPLGVNLGRCGEAGRLFAVAAGAAYRCPECGEVLPCVPTGRRGWCDDLFAPPPLCECCGASLTGCEL